MEDSASMHWWLVERMSGVHARTLWVPSGRSVHQCSQPKELLATFEETLVEEDWSIACDGK